MNPYKEPEKERLLPSSLGLSGLTPAEVPEQTMATKWKSASKRWAKEAKMSYFTNPASQRDFRVQFRSGKSNVFIGLYLAALAIATLYEYFRISSMGGDLSTIQYRLSEFYGVIVVGLGIMVSLVTPAISSTAIVIEKQRRSLELVFTSPIKPFTYLVGKLLSSYRFLWILLALSIPFSAICVVMGGASWVDVLSAYLLLSLQGLFFTAIGTLFSARCERPLSALIYTYGTVIAYLWLTTGGAFAYGYGDNVFGKICSTLGPFGILKSISSTINILGITVPSVLVGSVILLAATRLALLAASSVLAPMTHRDRATLRISSSVALALGAGCLATADHNNGGNYVSLGLLVMGIFVPFLSCYGNDAERRNRNDGVFKFREIFSGKPSGALPYILSTVVLCNVAAFVGQMIAGNANPAVASVFLVYNIALWSFSWSLGRLASSYQNGVRPAQVLQVLLFGAFTALPVPILSLIANWLHLSVDDRGGFLLGMFWILFPMFAGSGQSSPIVTAIALLLAAGGITYFSEKNRQRAEAKKQTARMASA